MIIKCAHCGQLADRSTGEVNRARKVGLALYCNKVCAGIARRSGKTLEQRKAEKVEYDRARRSGPLREKLLTQRMDYYRANAKEIYEQQRSARESDPEKMARYRDSQRACQSRAEWKAYKREYDRQYRANRMYGEMAPAYLLLMELESEVERQEPDYAQLQSQKGTLNKAQRRKRDGNKEDIER